MCRRCFYAYEKVLKAKEVIESSAVKAIVPVSSSTDSSQESAKRKSTSATCTTIAAPPPKRRPQPPLIVSDPTTGKTLSPGVAVSISTSAV